jgi:hypothetical protein
MMQLYSVLPNMSLHYFLLGKELSRNVFRKYLAENVRAVTEGAIILLPTAAYRVQSQFRARESLGGHSENDMLFLRDLRFPLPSIPPAAPHSPSSIIWDWYSGPKSGLRTKWTQSHPT